MRPRRTTWFPEAPAAVLRDAARRSRAAAVGLVGDVVDLLSGGRIDLTPPRRLRDLVGSAGAVRDHLATGEEFFGYFRDLCGLKPDEAVLDVGCGSGRMAVPLTGHLRPPGTYEGFDIAKAAVQWCTRHIGSRYPNFRFRHADVYNARYNIRGRCMAADYRFPYPEASFDLVFACSVFTHMLPGDMEHYLSEIARVMRDGARCLITFFLLNYDSLGRLDAGGSKLPLVHDFGVYRTADPVLLEAAVGYDEAFVRARYAGAGLQIQEPIRSGSWCGRERFLTFQDLIVARKG